MTQYGLAVLLILVVAVIADGVLVLKQGRLKGHRLTTRKGREIFAFQAIPYAKPPVGELRFQPPRPAEPWSGVLDATKEAPVCVQRGLFPTDSRVRGQEDCLYLNVYTPKIPARVAEVAPLDVMVWIHGGGWFTGSGNTDMYGPQYLLDKDVILVTINYRLGTLGFLSTEDAVCPGNNGMKDQVAALRWVRDNIAAFGGNPNSVTIFGESAGGASTHLHMLSPASKGLFHRSISQSGSATSPWAVTHKGKAKAQAEQVARLFDCPAHPSTDLISCLRKQEAYKLYNADLTITAGSDTPLQFIPVVENRVYEGDEAFLTDYPKKILLSKDPELVPWMVGLTAREGGFFPFMFPNTFPDLSQEDVPKELDLKLEDSFLLKALLYNPEDKALAKDVAQKIQKFYLRDISNSAAVFSSAGDMLTDLLFLSGTNLAVRLHSKTGATLYYYRLDYRGSNSFSTLATNSTVDYGAVHLDDLLYLFPQNHFFPNLKLTPEDEYMVETMTTLWVNFARTGNPASNWNPVSSPDVLDYIRITQDGLQPGQGLWKERSEFLESLPVITRYTTSDKDEL